MPDYQQRFPALYQFVAGYFNQDWTVCYNWENERPNYESIVRFFKGTNSPELVSRTVAEIEQIISSPLSEKELGKVLIEDLTCFYAPDTNQTHRQWLESVADILNEPRESKTRLQFVG